MEGYLEKWVNVVYRWQRRYFVLHGDTLLYSEKQGDRIKGKLHLRISNIVMIPDDPLRILINSGTFEIHLKAANLSDKTRWYHALRQAQQEAITNTKEKENYQDITDVAKDLNPSIKEYLITPNTEIMHDKLAIIWGIQAELAEAVQAAAPHMSKVPAVAEQLDKITKLSSDLKSELTGCVNGLESDKVKLAKLIKFITTKVDTYFSNNGINGANFFEIPVGRDHQQNDNEDDQFYDASPFKPAGPTDTDYDFTSEMALEKIGKSPINSPGLNVQKIQQYSVFSSVELSDKNSILDFLAKHDPIKHKHLTENPAFKNFDYTLAKSRDKLAAPRDLTMQVSIWSILKNFIGKDLSRVTLPIQLNMPLSVMQRFFENTNEYHLLDQADKEPDACMRLAHVMAFSASAYWHNTKRMKKPFNPILGETYEVVDEEKGLKYISEQVSHHPPITASHCETHHFTYSEDSQAKTSFGLKGLTFQILGNTHIYLKGKKEQYLVNRANGGVRGMIIPPMYIDFFGEQSCTNFTTGESGSLIFEERSSAESGGFKGKGEVRDRTGKVKYNLEARWDKYFKVINAETGVEKMLWETDGVTLGDEQWNFTLKAIQLNHLTAEMALKLPITDTRFRPDQRLWEASIAELAADEKHRLEEKQRAARKVLEQKNEHHKPLWFKETVDDFTGGKRFVYKGGYWEAREAGNFKNVPDLY